MIGEPTIYTYSQAPWYILFHMWVAITALFVGAIVLSRKKGNQPHRILGRTWAILMLTASISSFFIQSRDRFSLIHLFSVFVLIAIPVAVTAIRQKKYESHRKWMTSSYIGLCVAGLFTLLPYRMLGKLVFGP